MVKKFECPDVKDNYGMRKMIKKPQKTTYVLFFFFIQNNTIALNQECKQHPL